MNTKASVDIEEMMKVYFEKDIFGHQLGIKILEVTPGQASVEMTIAENMLNIHGIAHGGAIFTLADTAFGLASNTRGPAVAMQVSINYTRPAKPGAVIKATAVEEQLTRNTGIYNVIVESTEGEKIALFRGVVFRKL